MRLCAHHTLITKSEAQALANLEAERVNASEVNWMPTHRRKVELAAGAPGGGGGTRGRVETDPGRTRPARPLGRSVGPMMTPAAGARTA